MAEVRLIAAGELRTLIDDGRVREVWNALTDDYFTGEMIPGSRRVPVDRVGEEISAGQLPKHTEIVVYCSGPSCPQSRAAAEKLLHFGYENVRLFEGGLEAWKEADLPLDASEQPGQAA